MWIVPRQLLTSVSAVGTEALTLDSGEFSQLAEQSLMWRSKPSLARTWSQRWKRVNWIKHLSGRILKPATGKSLVTEWISSVAVTRANPFRQQDSDLENRTPDTSGHLYRGQLGLFDQDTASLRMSKDILPSALKTCATTWESWVTSLRQEYSQRLNVMHRTNANESLFWPTAAARDWKDSGQLKAVIRKDGKSRLDTLGRVVCQIENGPPAPENPSTNGKSQESWPTPIQTDCKNVPYQMSKGRKITRLMGKANGKLNQSWVEQLMGLPRVGWTQLPTEWIASASSETESSRPPVK